eukprot:COSAG02_NODE_823_length_16754_cov_69.933353_10_plen_55_part_00
MIDKTLLMRWHLPAVFTVDQTLYSFEQVLYSPRGRDYAADTYGSRWYGGRRYGG